MSEGKVKWLTLGRDYLAEAHLNTESNQQWEAALVNIIDGEYTPLWNMAPVDMGRMRPRSLPERTGCTLV